MRELRAGLCYGNDSPGVMSPTPKPFEAVYPPTDLSEVVASLRRELSSMDKVVEKLAAELAALQEAVRWVYVEIDGAVWVGDDLMDDAPISAADNPGEVAAILRALKEK